MRIKLCKSCQRTLSEDCFGSDRDKRDGLRTRCKECDKKARDKRYIGYHHEILEKNRKFRIRHRDRILRQKREYYRANIQDKDSKLYKYMSGPAPRFKLYRRHAKSRNLSFDLSREQFDSFWNIPCAYCGSDIKTIGLDRVDNAKGYSIDNVVACCHPCNVAKGKMSTAEFLEHVRKIYLHNLD